MANTKPGASRSNGEHENHPALPVTYSAAKAAIAKCAKIDECKDWADKAAALAVYARIAKDETLENDARRIRARAVRRQGELLKEIKPAKGANQNIRGSAPPKVTRKSVAEAAGLSEDQQKTALRVANVPEEQFEQQVESSKPPTVHALAEQGTRARPPATAEPPPAGVDRFPKSSVPQTEPAPAVEPLESAPTPSGEPQIQAAESASDELTALRTEVVALRAALATKLTECEYDFVNTLWALHGLMLIGDLTEKNLPAVIEAKPPFDYLGLLDLGKAIADLGRAWKLREHRYLVFS